jgi:hypothetical protein
MIRIEPGELIVAEAPLLPIITSRVDQETSQFLNIK